MIDIGGTHVKVMATAQDASRELESGPSLTPKQMVSDVRKLIIDWRYDVVSVGYPEAYDLELRPKLMVQTIHLLQNADVEPDVWKIEGLDRREDCERIVAATQRKGRDRRVENDQKIHDWIFTTASVKGFVAFAVRRTDFWKPSANFRAKNIPREAAVTEINRRFQSFTGISE